MTTPEIGARLVDKAAVPDAAMLRAFVGEAAFGYWTALRDWIAASYPGVFAPDWTHGGRKHGWSLRYKKSKAFCTLLPEYRAFSVVIVLGAAERDKVEARRDGLGPRLMALYDAAETFHDGKWLRIGIASDMDLGDAKALLVLKRPPRA
ncbi:hypothetical protein ANOBCDAF_04052 [Pleomorphomonas sp. T1.2MG-36]|uniref:DUF3788 domain-containing protein n=1 Tax=Pleomorphomonas sp. T1.2MG-36 TaxID=3041167 RepID=UPI0024779C22|nr:DUF3788 domain-containing protein [Pleomorphomonas sp. T1.2MG-36]CAI9417724.1 hypothetical protein ANOBCDAF_04052 [Pleomorphomonas sp. T1.2MG-36]